MTWRYIARRVITGEFIHWDLPIDRDELNWALNGAGFLRGTLSPDAGQLRADDGRPVLEEWGTLLYAEEGGLIRWGGLVIRSGFDGPAWKVEAATLSTYLHGIPYLGAYQQVGVDPMHAARLLWTHVQSFPEGDLGVVCDQTPSPVRLGKPAVPAYQEVQIGGEWKRKSEVPADQIEPSASAKLKTTMDANDNTLRLAAIDKYGLVDLPFTITIGREKIRVTHRTGTLFSGLTRGYDGTTATGHNAGTLVKHTGTPERTVAAQPAEPYSLVWWEITDCGQEFDQLVRETPFDYTDECSWVGDSQNIEHRLRLGYPRLGRRRTDLAFVQGDNITAVVQATRNGDDYASEVIGVGSGEGRTMLQVRTPVRTDRLRRPVVVTDKSINTASRLTALTRRELDARRNVLEFTSVEVVDHLNAPLGSWQLGDDILIQATLPWLGDVAVWERVIGWSLVSETRAQLRLQRADSYTYGGTS